jgi:protocatechuate 3,4-dioxygenase beta subunit
MRSIIVLLVGLSALAHAQTPTPDPNARPTGTIRGRIVVTNGRPARRASVRMLPPTGGMPRSVSADIDGRYEFTEVPAGDYRISAGKPGYLALEYGQQRAFERGKVVTIRRGETLEQVDIELPSSGAISGRVVDESGDPVEGIDVRVMQIQFAANRRQLLPVTSVGRRLTDDRGQYRLYGVPPGRYIVMASVVDQSGAPTTVILPPGYAPTYFPGTPKAAEARLVTIGLSASVDDVDFNLARVQTARISGTVLDSTGKPLRTGIIASTSQRSGGLVAEPLRGSSNADGTFEVRNVPPGEWVLQVFTGGNVNAGQEGEFVSRFVTVNGADVADVRLQTSAGSHVDGRFIFEGSSPPDPTTVTLTTLPSDFDRAPLGGPMGRATGQADGTFVLEGVNGPRRFLLMSAPRPWSLKAIRVNGRDVTDEPMSFGTKDESLADVEVVLTSTPTIVSGTVTDARGQVVTDYTVIVFATNADRWYQGSRHFTFTRPKADGTFTVTGLPPGQYYVAAVDAMQGTEGFGEWQDPAVLTSIAPRATRLTLVDGESASVTTRLIVR